MNVRRTARFAPLLLVALAPVADASPCSVIASDNFQLGPRPHGNNGRLRDAFVHDKLQDFWTTFPAVSPPRWISAEADPAWAFAASSDDVLQWPEDLTWSSNGTVVGQANATALIAFEPPAGGYCVSIHAALYYFLTDSMRVGFSSSASGLVGNFDAAGQLWLSMDGNGHWELHGPAGILLQGVTPVGATGWTPMAVHFDPATRLASVGIDGRWIAQTTLPFTPQVHYAGMEAHNIITTYQVANNFIVRAGDRSLFEVQPADVAASTGDVVEVAPVPGSQEFTCVWVRDGRIVGDGPTGRGSTIENATGAPLRIVNAQPGDSGPYECRLVSPCGTEWSRAAAVNVSAGCAADFNADGQADFFDYLDFVDAFGVEDSRADFDKNGQVDFFDYLGFAAAFSAGC
jgi:hypothetical protein